MASTRVLRVFRWREDDEPSTSEPIDGHGPSRSGDHFDEFDVDTGPETTVLDALVDVQRSADSTLAFRYACRVGMCGSCAMVVNGRERWACRTRLAALRAGPVTVRPLYHLPVIRDLVVDMAPFRARMASVGAVLTPAADAEDYAIVSRDSRERHEIDEAIECIGCGMCLSACTMAAHNERFPGPAALNRAFTLQRDHRDAEKDARWTVLLSDDALARCHGQGNCTAVCPMELAPATSIQRLRRMGTRRLLGRS
jgi:fumarate reductase iron-sulfur subunit